MRCVCGKYMHLAYEHLNYVVWRCRSCGRREVRWRGCDPEALTAEYLEHRINRETFQRYVGEIIEEVNDWKKWNYLTH
jgi:hypothetical protein